MSQDKSDIWLEYREAIDWIELETLTVFGHDTIITHVIGNIATKYICKVMWT